MCICEKNGGLMKAQQLRDKSPSELKDDLKALLKEQFNLRMQNVLGESPKYHYFKQVRRNIARIKTIISEKESNNESE